MSVVTATIKSNGNIGIGTETPLESLDISGGLKISTTTNLNAGTIRFNSNIFEGYDGTEWVQFGLSSTSSWISSAGNLYYDSGNVGIGTSNPATKLEVNGIITEESRKELNKIIQKLAKKGCDAVVLGCTEIPLLVDPNDCPLPTLDSTRLLARAAITRALE